MYRLPADGGLATHNTMLAAACVTCGIPVTTHRKIHEQLEEEQKTFTLAPNSVLTNRSIDTAAMLKAYYKGDLERLDPSHCLLDALRGLKNRAAIIRWLKQNQPHKLTLNADKRCPRTLYVPGEPVHPHAAQTVYETINTPDLALAAALGAIGIPIVRIDGTERDHVFVLSRLGFPMHAAPAQDGKQILADFGSGRLARTTPDHPFLASHAAVLNYRVLLDTLKAEMPMIFFEDDDGSGRCALIRGDAKTIAFDKATKFFKRPIRS